MEAIVGWLPPAVPAVVMGQPGLVSRKSHLSHLIPANPGESRTKFSVLSHPTQAVTVVRLHRSLVVADHDLA